MLANAVRALVLSTSDSRYVVEVEMGYMVLHGLALGSTNLVHNSSCAYYLRYSVTGRD
jgi:hypothetical protein